MTKKAKKGRGKRLAARRERKRQKRKQKATTALSDARDVGATSVRGVIQGDAFQLTYAEVTWGENFDTLCLSDQPISEEGCDASGPGTYTVLYGNFAHGEQVGWSFPVVQQRTGDNADAQFATEGSLTLAHRDPEAGVLALALELEFDEGTTSGEVRIPQ